MTRYLAITVLLVAGCFDSLVSDRCANGYSLQRGQCVAAAVAPDGGIIIGVGPDAERGSGHDGGGGTHDAGSGSLVDAPVCTADTTSDPDNCGTCGVVCASGLCIDSVCAMGVFGHVIAIGHDYQAHDATMVRLLGNAVALGLHHNVGVAFWTGTAGEPAIAGASGAVASGMQQLSRAWHQVAFPASPSPTALASIDVVVVDAQLGDGDKVEASAQPWASTFDAYLVRGGVIVVLEGSAGVSYRFAHGAGLYTASAPVDISGQDAYVVNAADAIALGVYSPYQAETTSVTLPGTSGAVVAASDGTPIAIHLTRP